MEKLHPTSLFRKNFKKYARSPQKVRAFERVADLLTNELALPAIYKTHPPKGNHNGCGEYHIENDYLLTWTDGDIIDLIRTDSHSELFGK